MQALSLTNKFKVTPGECFTKMLKFKGDNSDYGFNYGVNPMFYQQVRIHASLQNAKPVTKEKIYRQSDGVFQRGNTFIDKKVELHTDQFDEDTNFAMAIALKHKEVYLDDVRYFSEGEYEIDNNDFNEIGKGKAELLQQGFNKTNMNC
jgi:hypothetical protein